MADIRTADVDDLLKVLATMDDPDAIFSLLEDLFTVAAVGGGAASGGGEVLCGHRGRDRRVGNHYCARVQVPQLRRGRLREGIGDSGRGLGRPRRGPSGGSPSGDGLLGGALVMRRGCSETGGFTARPLI